jgi:hypothetical protein
VGDPVVRRGPSGSLGQPGDWSAGSLRALSRWRSRSRSAAGVTALSPKCAANASATVRMVRSSSTVCGKLAKCSMSSGFGAPEASHSPRGTPGPPSPAGRRSHRYKSAGANPASTGHGARRTGQHRAVPQQAYVLDAVRARRHSGDQARDFQMRVDAALASRRDVLRSQVAGRRAAPRPSPGPARRATRGSGHRRIRASLLAMQESSHPGVPIGGYTLCCYWAADDA